MNKLAVEGGKAISEVKIPIAKPVLSEDTFKEIKKILNSGYLVQNQYVSLFEKKFCKRVGAKHAYAVSSGTAALHTAYMSVLKSGDEVIVPDLTFISTASAVIFAGGIPVFADIDEETMTMNPEDVKEKISNKTKAIVPVHLFGNGADMKSLSEIAKDNDVYVISDSAQALGTEIKGKDVGSFNDLNCFSFYPSKMITTGEGGIVTTNNSELNTKGKLIRQHGQSTNYVHTILGLNYRMTEIAGVIGLNQLKSIDDFIAKRRKNALYLNKVIRNIVGLKPQKVGKGVNHSYNYYTIIMELDQYSCSRDQFVEAMQAENIECKIYYPLPLTKQPALIHRSKITRCPVANEISKKIFSIPVHPNLSISELYKIGEALKKVSVNYLN